MRKVLRTTTTVVMGLSILASACATQAQDDGRVTVVATTTILGEVAANVAGGAAVVEVLMPLGASPHDFVASSQQVASLYEADLVIANGLGLEEGLVDVLAAAENDGVNVLEIGPLLDPLPVTEADREHNEEREGEQEHSHGDLNPHVWLDPVRMQRAATAIADELTRIDDGVAWSEGADAYISELEAAHDEIETLIAAIPPEKRKLVTNHDSLGYFADRYGLAIVGVVIPGGSALGDPSSARLAELVAVIGAEGVPAIFVDTSEPYALAEAVAAEAGSEVVVVELYTGSLGEPGSGADTLIGLLLTDAGRIAAALGP